MWDGKPCVRYNSAYSTPFLFRAQRGYTNNAKHSVHVAGFYSGSNWPSESILLHFHHLQQPYRCHHGSVLLLGVQAP